MEIKYLSFVDKDTDIEINNIRSLNHIPRIGETIKLYNKESKKISYYLIDDIIYDIYGFTTICICQERKQTKKISR